MKSIVAVNTQLPTIDSYLSYKSGGSLRDHDIAIFDPAFPNLSRVNFSGGGSCIDIEDSKSLRSAMSHWSEEIRGALQAGKTVFFLLNEFEKDSAATGYTSKGRNQMTYSAQEIDNYQVLPFRLTAKNAKGRRIVTVDKTYQPFLSSLGEIAGYKVILGENSGTPIFATKDGAAVGSIYKPSGATGHLVLLPHFNLLENNKTRAKWTEESLRLSHAIVGQLVAIDKVLRKDAAATPPPEWIKHSRVPQGIATLDAKISSLEKEIAELEAQKDRTFQEKEDLLSFSRLLFENGHALETAIEEALRVLGFTVGNFRSDDLEIDHIIVGPSGIRMIGESEGKDNNPIDISKFRQLESNIQEDFQRDIIDAPAKGVLFGNGFRFTAPQDRPDQFTAKCITNAKRLQTALIKTCDLYDAVIYALDNPDDEGFREACRSAIENSAGDVVVFPANRL